MVCQQTSIIKCLTLSYCLLKYMMQNPLNMFESRCRDLFGKGFQYTPCLQGVSARYKSDSDNRSSEKIQGCLSLSCRQVFYYQKIIFSVYVYIFMSIHEFRCVCQVPRMSTCRCLCMHVSHMWYMCVPAYTYV